MKGNTIQTEVDSLISLVQGEQKISVRNAARRLGVPTSIVSEWAAFLEEEGMINIEYKFTTPFLVKKKLTAEQITQIKQGIREEKDLFDRKSNSTLTYLTKLENEVNSLKEIFNDLGCNFKSKLSKSKKEFNELRKAEEEKEKLNKEIIESKQKFVKQLTDLNKQLLKEQTNYKDVYKLLYNQSQIEGQILGIQDDELQLIKTTDKLLNKKLKELKIKLDRKKQASLKKKEDLTCETEANIRKMESKYMNIKDALENERQAMERLLKANANQEKQIEELRQDVLGKMKLSESKLGETIEDVKDVPRKLQSLLNKKTKIMKILNGISYNEKMLKEKLVDLMKRGSILNLTGNTADITDEIKELEKGLEDIAQKKGLFETEIKKIFHLLKK